MIREPATLIINNATRSDTAKYRCEVTAVDDQKSFDEIVIDLVVRGTLFYRIFVLFSSVRVLGLYLGCLTIKIKPIIMSKKGELA